MDAKEYIAFAKWFNKNRKNFTDERYYDSALLEFADILSEDNPNFNRNLFIRAAHR